MDIPDCYDPISQEERRQAQMDQHAKHFPVCGCCGHYVYSHEKFWTLNVRKSELIVCEDCKAEMDDSVCTMEALRYGA